jgi:alkanesulfonate monooxygenase SsuD/methylene tetrahydromethanopterin reductase-like flavin-dependent oxidoreductase (luciferase family)
VAISIWWERQQIVEWFVRLHKAGVDGVQVNFFDFIPDLTYFAEAVLPLMKQAGLRLPYPTRQQHGVTVAPGTEG